jgi:hypothetical protein
MAKDEPVRKPSRNQTKLLSDRISALSLGENLTFDLKELSDRLFPKQKDYGDQTMT